MAQIIIPQGISFEKWANLQGFVRPELNWPIPFQVDQWWDWAASAYYNSAPLYPNIPFPSKLVYRDVDHWKDWASHTVFQLI